VQSYPCNRLYRHLANCAINYNCLAAKNLFLQRWEAPLPTSRYCNAGCIACLSEAEGDCLSSHSRIAFEPTVSEISEVMANHLTHAREPIVSFGQGCEGEPLFMADFIVKAISKVRGKISRGTINMNTNASIPSKIKLLCTSGIDSFRVSLNSSREHFYNLYFRPAGYSFKDVLKSIGTAKKFKKFVSLNLFVFPGFSDSWQELKSLIKLIRDTGIDMLQLRNLSIDPDYYFQLLNYKNLKSEGVIFLVKALKREFPQLKIGYFNLAKEHFKNFKNVVI
jgi:MoaA/NifB/PqqE/SkfB family radical SAM enzyme